MILPCALSVHVHHVRECSSVCGRGTEHPTHVHAAWPLHKLAPTPANTLAYALGRRARLLMSLTVAVVYSTGVQHSAWSRLGPGSQVVWRLRHACSGCSCFQHPLVAAARGHGSHPPCAPVLRPSALRPSALRAGQALSGAARHMRHVTGIADRHCCALGSALLSIPPSFPSLRGPGPTRTQRMAMRRVLR